MKKTVVSVAIVLICFSCFSLGTEDHSADIAYILYGYDSISDLNKNASSDEKLSFDIMAAAVAFAVDEQGMGKTADLYQTLNDNLALTRQGKYYTLPSYSSFPSLGGGRHRAYNHQGFYWDYRDRYLDEYGNKVSTDTIRAANAYDSGIDTSNWTNKYLDRWIMGRDQILKPAVAAAFNLNSGDYRIETIAIMFYYAHMIGDLYEGSESSINQMGDITTYYFLLMQLESDLEDALESSNSAVYKYLEDCIMDGVFSHIRYSVRSCRSRVTAYLISKNFMQEQFLTMMRMMLGTDIKSITIR